MRRISDLAVLGMNGWTLGKLQNTRGCGTSILLTISLRREGVLKLEALYGLSLLLVTLALARILTAPLYKYRVQNTNTGASTLPDATIQITRDIS